MVSETHESLSEAKLRLREARPYVLVVDDDADVRSVARAVAEAAGFVVLEAGNGQEAVTTFLTHADEVAAVLLDLRMPVMGGEEACRQIRDCESGVPIILSSGYSPGGLLNRLVDAGPVEFLAKPYRVAQLSDLLEQVTTPDG